MAIRSRTRTPTARASQFDILPVRRHGFPCRCPIRLSDGVQSRWSISRLQPLATEATREPRTCPVRGSAAPAAKSDS